METKTYSEFILVTDWEKVEADDFYLTKEWTENAGGRITEAKELARNGNLFIAYVVPAVHYAIYRQMDASQIFIDEDGNEIIRCESAVIGNKHEHKEEYDY